MFVLTTGLQVFELSDDYVLDRRYPDRAARNLDSAALLNRPMVQRIRTEAGAALAAVA